MEPSNHNNPNNRLWSLTWYCMRTFLAYLLFLLLAYAVLTELENLFWNQAIPMVEHVLSYEKYVEQDRYELIPVKAYSRCSFLVFGERGEVLFASDEDIRRDISADELKYIPTNEDEFQYILVKTASGEMHISKFVLNPETGENEEVAYCALNENYQIVKGDLFAEDGSLSPRIVNLLRGYYGVQTNIVRTKYENAEGKKRQMVYISPVVTEEDIANLIRQNNRLWYSLIGLAVGGIILVAVIISIKLRKGVQPLNEIMEAYGTTGKYERGRIPYPREFRPIVEGFHQMTEELDASKELQMDAEKEKNRMIMDLSHDLKTPLTVIQGYAQALESGKVPEDAIPHYLGVLRKKSDLSVQMINNLMRYATLEHPDYQPEMRKTDLAELCRSSLIEHYDEIHNADMELEVEIPEDPIYMMVDSRIFANIFENLINNTIKYNPPGTNIFVALYEKGADWILEFADDGVGIPAELRKEVFKPFVVGEKARTTASVRGTGIGMSIIKRGVELHGGTIRLLDTDGSRFSTVFEMRFPKNTSPD